MVSDFTLHVELYQLAQQQERDYLQAFVIRSFGKSQRVHVSIA